MNRLTILITALLVAMVTQAGVKARINNQFTFGGGYWMDIEKITDHVNFQGFDITLGYIF